MTRKELHEVEVVGLGQASLDFLGKIPSYPEEDGKVEMKEIFIQSGGPVSTALVTLSRLGINTSFIGSVSDDYFGKEIVGSLNSESVNITFLKITPGHYSQVAFISITEKQGHRNVFWHRGDAPFVFPGEIDLSHFPGASILHLDGLMIEASIEAARQAKKKGMMIVLDAGTMRNGSLELISMVDVLIASEHFAEPLVGIDAPPELSLKVLAKYCSGDIVITLGAEGSIGLFQQKIIYQDAFPVEVVDTTGAGDVYHGAYIYGLLKGWKMKKCMSFASVVSALKCREIGARKGIPRIEDIKKYLDRSIF